MKHITSAPDKIFYNVVLNVKFFLNIFKFNRHFTVQVLIPCQTYKPASLVHYGAVCFSK